jgi:NADPH-dependent 2,4-dienoyl-CoA reductase/sulfur reductase-like enzyme
MFCTRSTSAVRSVGRSIISTYNVPKIPTFATVSLVWSVNPPTPSLNHKVVVIGGGSAGLAISHQLLRSGKFSPNDIAIIDPSP